MQNIPSSDIIGLLRDVQTGNLNTFKHFCEIHKIHWSVLKYQKTGDTILHVAARLGLIDTVTYLLNSDNGKFVDIKNRDAKTSLHEAAQFSQYHIIKILLHYGADVNALKRADWTPLMLACTKSTTSSYLCVDLLLQNGALVNYANKDGWTPLHLISREGNTAILTLLISFGIDINKLTKNGRSALHIAALHGHLIIVKKLLSLGLDLNIRDSCGNTSVHEAVLGGHLNICDLFLNNEHTDFTVKNYADLGVLHLAACVGELPMIEYLVNKIKIDINIKNTSKLTPLHCAARKKHEDAINLLVKLGADYQAKDEFGRCASQYFNIGR